MYSSLSTIMYSSLLPTTGASVLLRILRRSAVRLWTIMSDLRIVDRLLAVAANVEEGSLRGRSAGEDLFVFTIGKARLILS